MENNIYGSLLLHFQLQYHIQVKENLTMSNLLNFCWFQFPREKHPQLTTMPCSCPLFLAWPIFVSKCFENWRTLEENWTQIIWQEPWVITENFNSFFKPTTEALVSQIQCQISTCFILPSLKFKFKWNYIIKTWSFSLLMITNIESK